MFDLKIILFFEFEPLFAHSFRLDLNCWTVSIVLKIAIQATLHLVRGILVTATRACSHASTILQKAGTEKRFGFCQVVGYSGGLSKLGCSN